MQPNTTPDRLHFQSRHGQKGTRLVFDDGATTTSEEDASQSRIEGSASSLSASPLGQVPCMAAPMKATHTLFHTVRVPSGTWCELPQRRHGTSLTDIVVHAVDGACEARQVNPVLRVADSREDFYPSEGHENLDYTADCVYVAPGTWRFPSLDFQLADWFRVVIISPIACSVTYTEELSAR